MHAAILCLSLLATAPTPDTSPADPPVDALPPLPPPRSATSLPPLPEPRDEPAAEPAPEAPASTGATTVSTPSLQPAVQSPAQPSARAAGLPVAHPPAPPLASPSVLPPRGAEMYVGKLVLADGVAWALVFAGLKGDIAPSFFLGLGSLALAAPFVHMANGHRGRAWGSFGLRMGGLMAGGVMGGIGGAVVGFVVGEAIDILALGGVAANRRARPGALAFTPVLAPTAGGGLLGVAAVF